ncbi:hypothetical protein [Trinickia sp.]|uniref:hypothetical protein n=1 Tax=Trinickia sp. TaxID=2571163 RepID=UPI003F805F38
MPLRRSLTVRAASLAFALVCTAAVHFTAAQHLGVPDAIWLAAAAFAALAVSYVRFERRQPMLLELTPDGVIGYDAGGRTLFYGPIVGAAQWAERLLVLAVAGADARRPRAVLVAADSVDGAAFRELAVRGRQGAY